MNSLQFLSTQVDRVIGQASSRRRLKPIEEGAELNTEEKIKFQTDSPQISAIQPISQVQVVGESSLDSPQSKVSSRSSLLLRPFVFVYHMVSLLLSSILYYASSRRTLARSPSYIDSSQLHLQSPSDASKRHKRAQSNSASDHFKPAFSLDPHRHHNGRGSAFPLPPRPLLSKRPPKKTLVLDLDETLIHSLSRGSKFSADQMVEVKFGQLATLYFVNKRPYCDSFLRSVAQWYDLVVFTASIQAYADPMIDWLEREGKFFSSRYYRQHCTPTSNGGYVKDLSKVNPDLSKVIIIDNSPISYSMNRTNAIGIEGWISDPSDYSLLHLVPLLHALRYSTDVRSFLGLSMGESTFE